MTVTVVLTREPPRNDELRATLDERSRVLEVPLTTTTFVEESDVRRAIAASKFAPHFQTIAVTSARAARYVPLAVSFAETDATLAVVGPASARAVTELIDGTSHGDVLQAPAASASSLASVITRGPVLHLGAAQSRPELGDGLVARGFQFCAIACYETVPAQLDGFAREQIRLADILVIGAPSAWRVVAADVRRATTVVVTGDATADIVSHDHSLVVVATRGELARTLSEVVTTLSQDVDRTSEGS